MDIKEFYKEVESVMLFPGSLDELNGSGSYKSEYPCFGIINLDGSKKYLIGSIIPSIEDVKEKLGAIKGVMKNKTLGRLGISINKEEEEEMGMLEKILMDMIGTPEILNTDIRLKAKRIGANGLIRVQLYDKDSVYMGIPIKRECQP